MKQRLLLFLLGLCASIGLYAQVKVTGTVLAASDKEPLVGVTITIKGTKKAVVTDVDGKFSIAAPSQNSMLSVTYVGMKPQTVKVKTTPMTILMESSEATLTEVVVTGMGTQDKRLFTGATSKVDADGNMLAGVSDVSRSLEGKAAGVSVQNVSGTFGTAPKIRVRGATSIYGSSKPLWVVDGVILEDNVELDADALSSGDANTLIASAIAGLSSDDIESFQILKDGASTSIYGARAMAGVIVVTTKQGKKGHTSASYTGELTYRLKPSYREYNICNSQEQMGIYREMEQKGWLNFASLANASTSGIYGSMYKLINTYDPATGQYGLANTETARNAYLREAEMRNTDWFDLLFNDNLLQTHSLSVSGGSDKGNFYTSLSYMTDPGWYKSSDVDRYTFNANASYDVSKNLRISLRTQDSYRSQKAPGTLSQDVDVVNGAVSRSFDINPFSYALNTSRTTDPNAILTRNFAPFNIFDELQNNFIDLTVVDVKFQGDIQWKPLSCLTLNALGSMRYVHTGQSHYVKDHSNQAEAYRAGISPENATIRASNPYLYTDPSKPNSLPVSVLPSGGILYNTGRGNKQLDFRASGTFNKTFDSKHLVNLFAAFEASKIDRNTQTFDGWGICYDNGNLPFTDWRLFKQMSEEGGNYYSDYTTRNRSMAYIANGSYMFDNRYILNGTVRYEGSNRLGKATKSRWLPTWNVSGSWNVDSESWFANPVLATTKLRASYSLTADAGPLNVSNALPIYYPSRPWRQDPDVYEQSLSLSSIGNSELTYEKKHELDLGADLGFLNNRINVVFDWYQRNNYDLIGRIYTQGVGGTIAKMANVASMKSHGVEFTVSTQNLSSKALQWTTDLTFSYAKNEITNLKSRSRVIDLVGNTGFAMQGYPVRAIFSIPFVGLSEDGLPMIINEKGQVTSDNINFQEYENIGFLKYEGPVDAPITGGLGNNLRWNGFMLNVFLTYSFGNKVRLDPVFSSGYSDLTAMPREFMNRWVESGDEQYTSIPAIASRRQVFNNKYISYGYNAYNYSTARIANGDFVRLKEVSLTWNFPNKVNRALRINGAYIKLATTNLCLIYSDKRLNGQDPEFFNSGGVASPNPKQFTFTLHFNL